MFGWDPDAVLKALKKQVAETGADTAEQTAAAEAAGVAGFEPDCCLINLYDADGRMGLHQDKDEADFAWPIVSFSFGADALFALGGDKRRDAATSFTLSHGDVLAMHGPARLRDHDQQFTHRRDQREKFGQQ